MSRYFAWTVCISFALPAGIAHADLPPGDVACEGKSTGDACTTADDVAGTCQYDDKDNFVCEPRPDAKDAKDGCSASTLSRNGLGIALVVGAAGAFALARRRNKPQTRINQSKP